MGSWQEEQFNIFFRLLNFLEQNIRLRIDEVTKQNCANALVKRHVYAIFYQRNECYADIVYREEFHQQIHALDLINQMDDDALCGIINNKGAIRIIIANQDPNLRNLLRHQRVVVDNTPQRVWTEASIKKKTLKESILKLAYDYGVVFPADNAKHHGNLMVSRMDNCIIGSISSTSATELNINHQSQCSNTTENLQLELQ